MTIRTAMLAEVQALSLASLIRFGKAQGLTDAKAKLDDAVIKNDMKDLFKTVGLATSIRINEQWGTQPIYGIEAPTRPVMIPGNSQVSLSIERLTLDKRDNFHYITSPDYWYSLTTQRAIGASNYLFYSYIVIRDKEDFNNIANNTIYACMPSSSSTGITADSATIMHNVDMVGFKLSYLDLLDALDDTILSYSTTVIGKDGKFDNLPTLGIVNKLAVLSDGGKGTPGARQA